MAKVICPLLKKPCLEHGCKFWVHVLGKHPQTNKDLDHYDCSITWLPVLLIENAKLQRETGAAVETLRNAVALPQILSLESDRTTPKLLEKPC